MRSFPSAPSRPVQPAHRAARRHGRPPVGVAALAALALSACDFPTAPPRVETTFVVPGEETELSVAELLPASVSLSAAGGTFQLEVPGSTFARTLADMCPPCAAFDGAVVPKPAFTYTFGDELALPAQVVSATLAGGSVELRLTHGFGFDPIRPSASTRGEITATLRSGGALLGQATIRGTDTAFPSGGTVARTIPLQAGEVSGPLEIEIALTSPEGDPVRVDADAAFSVAVAPGPLAISRATVDVQAQAVSVESVTLDTEDVDSALVERVRGGAVLVDLSNPWPVSGTLTLRLDGITRVLQLAPGATSQRVELSGSELRQILGRVVTLSVEGTLSPASAVTLTPDQRLSLDTTLSLVVELGGSGEQP